jgi:DNA replication protein DnaC
MGSVQSKNLMQELKLTGMLEQYENTLASATAGGLGHAEFFDLLLQSEYDERRKRKINGRIKGSKLPNKWVFEDFDYTANRSITKSQIKDLMTLKWLDQGRPILLIGQTGVGKSFIAEAISMQVCRNGKTSLWMDISAFLEALALSRTSGTYIKLREKLSRPDVLVIDDFGMRKLSSTEAQDLCEILEARSHAKSTVITTQLPLDHWEEVIEDTVIADAVKDRLKHAAITLNLTGGTYRLVKAKKLDETAH